MSRRDFLFLLGAAAAAGLPISNRKAIANPHLNALYDLPRFGNVHLLHMTDCHAQLNPVYFREPSMNLGVGLAAGKLPHIVGENLLKAVNVPFGTELAHAFSCLDFEESAIKFGRVGGFAHLKTLVDKLRSDRPGAILLDGGDTWQGSGTALWSKGQDMVDACLLLGVDVMTAHWEMTLGADRVQDIVNNDFSGKINFLAQNIKTFDFDDPVFDSFTIKEMNGVPVAIIGQAFPYTPIANPSHLVPDWSFGIREYELQQLVNRIRKQGIKVVVLLSHNGMDVDLKLGSRVTGLDAILGGHTHDGMPVPVVVPNRSGHTVVTNGGSNGKFLGVLDFAVSASGITDFRYRLLPVFSKYIEPDKEMEKLIHRVRQPFEQRLSEPLAITEGLTYRRGTFNGSFDEIILDALIDELNADIALSPGFRWGTSLLPNSTITMEALLEQTATTYSYSTLSEMTGETIKLILEDVADNIFNPDPYYQQGGDMVRVGGMTYTIEPGALIGSRISDMRIEGVLIDPNKVYKVAGWAPVRKDASGELVWDLVSRWLKHKKIVSSKNLNTPRIKGFDGSLGMTERCGV
ncbi:thiosulfohydrolase SoxB [Burkholderiales bacterium]|nr:thiosulfohydrolase SoxB [Burkholderiales bacterium]